MGVYIWWNGMAEWNTGMECRHSVICELVADGLAHTAIESKPYPEKAPCWLIW